MVRKAHSDFIFPKQVHSTVIKSLMVFNINGYRAVSEQV